MKSSYITPVVVLNNNNVHTRVNEVNTRNALSVREYSYTHIKKLEVTVPHNEIKDFCTEFLNKYGIDLNQGGFAKDLNNLEPHHTIHIIGHIIQPY